MDLIINSNGFYNIINYDIPTLNNDKTMSTILNQLQNSQVEISTFTNLEAKRINLVKKCTPSLTTSLVRLTIGAAVITAVPIIVLASLYSYANDGSQRSKETRALYNLFFLQQIMPVALTFLWLMTKYTLGANFLIPTYIAYKIDQKIQLNNLIESNKDNLNKLFEDYIKFYGKLNSSNNDIINIIFLMKSLTTEEQA